MKTLKLFNGVLAKDINTSVYVSDNGYVIEPSAMWAKDQIISYYKGQQLSGNDLNKTFHKSWRKVLESTRLELAIEQIRHYTSTYGSNFEDEIYIPSEVLNVPEKVKITFKVIRGYSREELVTKCLDLLQSGIALDTETIDDVLSILFEELDYTFDGSENIRNKEAMVKLAEVYGVLPNDPVEFLRYIIYRTTDDTLLIKNDELINKIKTSSYNPTPMFKKFGLTKLATIFNRFKPLFLAYKNRSGKTINKISKLSKIHHEAMVSNPLNEVTSKRINSKNEHWLENATIFSLLKAFNACYTRLKGQKHFLYRIRNGKSWADENENVDKQVCQLNLQTIYKHIKSRIDLSGKKIYFPKNVEYAIPTSEKMFVGNIPSGTKVTDKKLAVGMYWEDAWGARDLDLSGLNLEGKIGWNASYRDRNGQLIYSGDLTSAPNGAVEYLYADNGLRIPTLVEMNVFSGREDSGYKIIVGSGSDVTRNYMMDPNNLIFEVKTECVQKQMCLGLLLPQNDKQTFVLINTGMGSMRVSGNSEVSKIATQALVEQYTYQPSLNDLLINLGATEVDNRDDADIDLSVESLQKDTIINLLK